jgi:hypothetical protein
MYTPRKALVNSLQVMWAWGKSGAVVLPPHPYRTLKLMSCILGLQHFCHPQNTKLVFYCIYPLFCIQGFSGFLENWWTGVHEILETTILVCFMPLGFSPRRVLSTILRNAASIFYCMFSMLR